MVEGIFEGKNFHTVMLPTKSAAAMQIAAADFKKHDIDLAFSNRTGVTF